MKKFLCISMLVLTTPCLYAMEEAPLTRPQDAVEWVEALVQSPGPLSGDTVNECFRALTEEYLPLFEELKNDTLEDKIIHLNDERKCRVDHARKLLLKTWAEELLKDVARSNDIDETRFFGESVASCIALFSLVINSDDLPITIYHRAVTTTEEDLRKATFLLPRIRAEIETLRVDEQQWAITHNQISEEFTALCKYSLTNRPQHVAENAQQDAQLSRKNELFQRALQALQESKRLDTSPTAESGQNSNNTRDDEALAPLPDLVLLVLQRAFFTDTQPSIEDDYKVRVAAHQLTSQEAAKGLEIMYRRTDESRAALIRLHDSYQEKCAALRALKRGNVLLRARLRRLANLDLSQEDERLLEDFEGGPSEGVSGCVIS